MQKIFELELEGGKQIGFRFNMYAFGQAARLDGGISITELFDRLGQGDKKDVDVSSLLNLFYSGALTYVKGKNQKPDFTDVDVSDWIEEIGLKKATEIFTEALRTFTSGIVSKNQTAPQETGQES